MKSVRLIPTVLLAIFLQQPAFSQCDVSSAQAPDLVSNTSFPGSDFDWDNASFVLSSNNQYASAGFTLGLFATVQSDLMMLSDFDISVPLAVTICGIEVKIERKASGLGILGASVRDNIVQLVKNGSATGTNKATATNWTGSKVTTTYGGSSDLWGTTWTSADVNNANFGLSFSAELRSGAAGLFLSADIDNVTITVYYQHIVLPGYSSSFSGNAKGNFVELEWKTKEEHNIKEFAVERQSVHGKWETVARLDGTSNHGRRKEFTVLDMPQSKNNQYRIKFLAENGTVAYSEVITVQLAEIPAALFVCVDPVNKTLVLRSDEPIQLCRIIGPDGKTRSYTPNLADNKNISIPSTLLPQGHFIVEAHIKGNKRRAEQFYLRK